MKLKTLIPKSEVRRTVVERRREISPEEVRNKSKLISNRLTAVDEYLYAKKIHTYISTKAGEVDTRALIDFMMNDGKLVVLPKLNKAAKKFQRANFTGWDNLIKNHDGYYEPSTATDEDLTDIDLIIVPAMAVSLLGQRVGYGGGFYDGLLKKTHAVKIVLALEFQVFDHIETDPHDIRVDKVITERRVINTREPMERNSELL